MTREALAELQAGDEVLLSGTLYTARDAAHKRFAELLDAGKPLPIPLEGQTIYYCGPAPAPPGRVIGPAGPTTASRMDRWTPRLLSLGLLGMIGKGGRSHEVAAAIQKTGAVYFAALGGAGALLAQRVLGCEIIAFPELGPEAIRRLTVDQFPVITAIDSRGKSAFV